MTINVVALLIVFIGSIITKDPVLTSVQILWVNLIMDTFAALALATEPPSDSQLDRNPVARNEKIINSVMARNIFGWSLY
jgi:magnesium-transporting ATPase (P-type)